MQAGANARHVYIGIAANRGTAQVLQQIELARARGAKGVSIYSYSSITPDLWSALSAGPFARPATVPARQWL
jgi:DNA-binding MurR/RpiR family transcriptional regulator